MSNRKPKRTGVGGGIDYHGRSYSIVCDGGRHWRLPGFVNERKSSPAQRYESQCDCKQFMTAMFAVFGMELPK